MESFDQGIFFDNEETNISGAGSVCVRFDNVLCVKVNHTVPKPAIPWGKNPLKEYLTSIGPNTYVDILQACFDTGSYDNLSGIKGGEIAIFNKWNHETQHLKKRVAIFDWDRTITVVEGLFAVNDRGTMTKLREEREALRGLPDVVLNDMLVYLLGGEERLAEMRAMFRSCLDSNIKIIILTNSGSCEMPAFDALLHELFQGVPFTKICSKVRTNVLQGKGDYLLAFFQKMPKGGKKNTKRNLTRKIRDKKRGKRV